MNNPSQDDLLGFVLGALDADQQQQVQQLIDKDPDLEEQLLDLKSALAPLELMSESTGHRPGLARRTCELLAALQKDDSLAGGSPLQTEPALNLNRSSQDAPVDRCMTESSRAESGGWARTSWSLNDLLVTTAAIAVLVAMLFPALSYWRHYNQRVLCENNLRQLGVSFVRYSEINDGNFIVIPTRGKKSASGIVGPMLKEAGLLEDDSQLACPGVYREAPIYVPLPDSVEAATGPQLIHFQRTMGGDYGYAMGYMENGDYITPKFLGRSNHILAADSPSPKNVGFASANHGGYGQNCLFEDGHCKFLKGHALGNDPIYINDMNVVAAGVDAWDCVIGASYSTPAPTVLEPQIK